MIRTSWQLKELVRNMSKGDSAKAQTIIRNYMTERFLERLSISPYRNNMILKGGVLMVAAVGIENRSTMDIDMAFKNLGLSEEIARKTVEEITEIKLDDGVAFEIKSTAPIMDEADYPGIRLVMEAMLETMRIPLKIDFSAGDIITPHETRYALKLLFEKRTISVLAYNFETILAEKIETVLARGVANSRMRDFYDIFALDKTQAHNIDKNVLKTAFINTSERRGTSDLCGNINLILQEVAHSPEMIALWASYRRKFEYAANIDWSDIMQTVEKLCRAVKP